MISWKNLDELEAFKKLSGMADKVKLTEVMAGENGAERVGKYCIPMAEGLLYNFAAKKVDDDVLALMEELASEAQLADKFEELYNGGIVNTGEKRLVLHHLQRGQLGKAQ